MNRQKLPDRAASLSDAEIDEILDDLASFGTPEQIIAQREHPRLPFKQTVKVACEIAGEGGLGPELTGQSHDLSDGGLGLIISRFVPTESRCEVTVLDMVGEPIRIRGRFVCCEPHSRGLFRAGIQFDRPIQSERFVGMRQAG